MLVIGRPNQKPKFTNRAMGFDCVKIIWFFYCYSPVSVKTEPNKVCRWCWLHQARFKILLHFNFLIFSTGNPFAFTRSASAIHDPLVGCVLHHVWSPKRAVHPLKLQITFFIISLNKLFSMYYLTWMCLNILVEK